MQYTNLYNAFKKLDRHHEKELIAAVKAHGGQYRFVHIEDDEADEDETDEAPVILAENQWTCEMEYYRVSLVEVHGEGDNEYVAIYGWRMDPDWPDEERIENVEHGYLSNIIIYIPETENVKDVSMPFEGI